MATAVMPSRHSNAKLFHELKQLFPELPDDVVKTHMQQNSYNHDKCVEDLKRQSDRYLYGTQSLMNSTSSTPNTSSNITAMDVTSRPRTNSSPSNPSTQRARSVSQDRGINERYTVTPPPPSQGHPPNHPSGQPHGHSILMHSNTVPQFQGLQPLHVETGPPTAPVIPANQKPFLYGISGAGVSHQNSYPPNNNTVTGSPQQFAYKTSTNYVPAHNQVQQTYHLQSLPHPQFTSPLQPGASTLQHGSVLGQHFTPQSQRQHQNLQFSQEPHSMPPMGHYGHGEPNYSASNPNHFNEHFSQGTNLQGAPQHVSTSQYYNSPNPEQYPQNSAYSRSARYTSDKSPGFQGTSPHQYKSETTTVTVFVPPPQGESVTPPSGAMNSQHIGRIKYNTKTGQVNIENRDANTMSPRARFYLPSGSSQGGSKSSHSSPSTPTHPFLGITSQDAILHGGSRENLLMQNMYEADHMQQRPIAPAASWESLDFDALENPHQRIRSDSVCSEDQAYTQALILHQKARYSKLQEDLQKEKEELNTIKIDLDAIEEYMEGRRQRSNHFPKAKDLHDIRDKNRKLQIEIQLMTREVDLHGTAPLGIVDSKEQEDFYKNMPQPVTGQQLRPPRPGSLELVTNTRQPPLRPPPFSLQRAPFHNPPPPYDPYPPQASANNPEHQSQQATMRSRNDEDIDEGPRWNCASCTLENHPALDKCEVCEMPRKGTPR
ncbi:unnamed protein product [Owenia fusiformis]|uniref:Uncharacterized protein n=1 Tax=Owenia fusiformis TaxID=6347 RepID=A0A8J1TAR9_OWEFU|nr:unnamed protein product [Owenia fusiformis]